MELDLKNLTRLNLRRTEKLEWNRKKKKIKNIINKENLKHSILHFFIIFFSIHQFINFNYKRPRKMNNEQKVNKVKKLLFITTWKTNNTNRDNIRFQLKSHTYTIRYVKISLHNNISTRVSNTILIIIEIQLRDQEK